MLAKLSFHLIPIAVENDPKTASRPHTKRFPLHLIPRRPEGPIACVASVSVLFWEPHQFSDHDSMNLLRHFDAVLVEFPSQFLVSPVTGFEMSIRSLDVSLHILQSGLDPCDRDDS